MRLFPAPNRAALWRNPLKGTMARPACHYGQLEFLNICGGAMHPFARIVAAAAGCATAYWSSATAVQARPPKGVYASTIARADVGAVAESILVRTWRVTFSDSTFNVRFNDRLVVSGLFMIRADTITLDRGTGA